MDKTAACTVQCRLWMITRCCITLLNVCCAEKYVDCDGGVTGYFFESEVILMLLGLTNKSGFAPHCRLVSPSA